MPGYNSMGPMGQGPITGRGWGSCDGGSNIRKTRAGNAFSQGMGRWRMGRRKRGFCISIIKNTHEKLN